MVFENIIIKDWRTIDLSVGLIYPNIYQIGMSSYSIRLLYNLINSQDNFACERIFLPDNVRLKFPASEDHSSENLLRSIENKVLPIDFDILGFSLHFENDFKNIFWLLEKASIPLTSKKRQILINKKETHFPLIIGGGPVITSNPIPISKVFDILFIGDSEPNLIPFLNLFLELKDHKISYDKFLDKVSKIKGIYIPSLNNKIQREVLKNLDDSPNPTFQLMSIKSGEKNIFEENFFVEVNRGCPFQCKFCISSFHNSPFRNRSFENIKNIIEEGIKYSKFETISLIGSCVSSHPKFKQICEFIINTGKRLTVPSIRIEHVNEDLIKILERGKIKTITIAPESGSEPLRYALGKNISNEKILTTLNLIRKSSIRNVKLYFLIGLPHETGENIQDIINLLKEINKLNFGKNALRINVNPLIPKLNTPYEKEISFYLNKNLSDLMDKFKLLERELKQYPSIKLKFRNYKSILKNARLQTMFSLGDQKVSELIINYYGNGGNFVALDKAEKMIGFSLDDYLLKIKNCYSPWVI